MSDHSNDDWKWEGIFDDLTPEMFALETSAVLESSGEFAGREAFDTAVDEQLRNVQSAFAASGGKINPIAVLFSATMQRNFTPDRDENLGQFLERLQREARVMGARWLFIAKESVFQNYDHEEGDEKPDPSSAGALSRADAAGSGLKAGILWYAEYREGEGGRRLGTMTASGNRITESVEGDEEQRIAVFSLILDGTQP